MKASKRLLVCASCLFMGSDSLLAASEIFVTATTFSMRRSLPVRLSQVTPYGSSVFFSPYFVGSRKYSSSNDDKNQAFMQKWDVKEELRDPAQSQPTLTRTQSFKYEDLLIQSDRLCKEIKSVMDTLAQLNSRPNNLSPQDPLIKKAGSRQQKPTRAQAVITPVNSEDLSVSSPHMCDQDPKFGFEHEHAIERSTCSGSKESMGNLVTRMSSTSQMTENDVLPYQSLSGVPAKLREELVNRIMNYVKSSHHINRSDVVALLDLCTALANRTIDGINKVLNGQTNAIQSGIYANVVRYVESKQSSLDVYRGLYAKLSDAFSAEAMDVVSQAVESMVSEQKHLFPVINKIDGKSIGRQQYIALIVEGANPLYPIYPNEVEAILGVYDVLPNCGKKSIKNVLAGKTNTPQSHTYNNVVKYLESQKSTLKSYRDMHLRLSKSLNERAQKIIDIILDNKKQSVVDGEQTRVIEASKQIENDPTPLDFPRQTFMSPVDLSTSKSSTSEVLSDNSEEMRLGKYSLSKKEKERLDRVYGLLPEFRAKSITGVLSGTTQNKTLPIWEAITDVIDQIRQEAEQEGDRTSINLKYLQKLYWAAVRVTGSGGSREKIVTDSNEKIKEPVSKKKSIVVKKKIARKKKT